MMLPRGSLLAKCLELAITPRLSALSNGFIALVRLLVLVRLSDQQDFHSLTAQLKASRQCLNEQFTLFSLSLLILGFCFRRALNLLRQIFSSFFFE